MAKKNKKPDYKAHLFSIKYILFDFVKWFCWWQCLLWYRIKKKYDGPEAKQRIKGGAIVTSNHVGFSDPFVLQCVVLTRRWHFLFMTDLIRSGFSRWFYKYVFLSFPIDREKPSYQTMKFLSEYVKGGNLLALFPEGHIRRDDVIDNYKGGALLIAYLSNKPIIPMYHKRRKSIWNMTRVVIGKPFNVKEKIGPVLNQEKLNACAEELHQYELYLQQLCEEDMKK